MAPPITTAPIRRPTAIGLTFDGLSVLAAKWVLSWWPNTVTVAKATAAARTSPAAEMIDPGTRNNQSGLKSSMKRR